MDEETLRKMAIEQYLQEKILPRFIVSSDDPRNGFLNGSIDTSRGIPSGIGINPKLLDLTLIRLLHRCESL